MQTNPGRHNCGVAMGETSKISVYEWLKTVTFRVWCNLRSIVFCRF